MALLDQDQIDIGDYSFFILYGEIKAAKPRSYVGNNSEPAKPFVFDNGLAGNSTGGSSSVKASYEQTSEQDLKQSSGRQSSGRGFGQSSQSDAEQPMFSGIKTSEMSMSQKLSSIADQEHNVKETKKNKVFAALGVVTLISLVSFLILAASLF